MPNTLPIARLINVTVNLAPSAAQSQNLSTLLILGTSTVIDVVQRMRSYATLAAVAADFGTTAPEYLAANLWFQQNPAPNNLLIGRWAQAASSGQLICGPLSATNKLIATWTAINNGAFKIQIDALAQQSLTGLNFSGVTTLNGVASVIGAVLTGGTVVYDSVNNRFVFTSNTTGVTSQVSFLTAGAVGTDISAMLAGLATSAGAYQANGIVAESVTTAVTLFDTNFGQQWYGLVVLNAVVADHQNVSSYIESATTKHFYGVTTQDANTLVASNTTNLAYLLQQAKPNKTAVQYSSTTPYAVVSLLARILTTDWQGNRTAITLMYKTEPGITAESLTSTQVAAIEGFNANVFINYNNQTAIIENGVTSSGQFIDTVIGIDALAVGIQTAVYNALYTSTTKIPQTDRGMHILVTAVEQVCQQFEVDGLLAAGTWTTGGFGALNQGDYMPKGFYVYAAPVSTQTQAQRASRLAVPIQVAAKLAGAVHTANVTVNVNS